MGPQGAGGFGAVPGPRPSLGPADCLHAPTGSHPSALLDKHPSIPVWTQGAKQSRGAICPSVQAVIKPSLHPLALPCCHIPTSFHASNLSFPFPGWEWCRAGSHFLVWPTYFHPQSISAIPASSEKSHVSRWPRKLGLAVPAQAALINQLWKSIT